MISTPECYGFDDLGTRGIFSVVGLCFQFFLLHLNPFLKIQNHSQNPKPKSQSQSEQKLLWVRVFSIKAKTVESRSQSKQKLLWVRGSCFLGWSIRGNSSLRDSSSTWIFLIGNRVFET